MQVWCRVRKRLGQEVGQVMVQLIPIGVCFGSKISLKFIESKTSLASLFIQGYHPAIQMGMQPGYQIAEGPLPTCRPYHHSD